MADVSTGATPDLADYEIIGFSGKYLIPKLTNMHVRFVPAMPVRKLKPGKNRKRQI